MPVADLVVDVEDEAPLAERREPSVAELLAVELRPVEDDDQARLLLLGRIDDRIVPLVGGDPHDARRGAGHLLEVRRLRVEDALSQRVVVVERDEQHAVPPRVGRRRRAASTPGEPEHAPRHHDRKLKPPTRHEDAA